MIIFKDNIRIGEVEDTKKMEGAFGTKLIGLNVCPKGETVSVEPVYRSNVKIMKDGEVTYVDVALRNNKQIVFVLSPHFPFIGWNVFDEKTMKAETA